MKQVLILTALALAVSAFPSFARDNNNDDHRGPQQNYFPRRQDAGPAVRGEQRDQKPNVCPYCRRPMGPDAPQPRWGRRDNVPQPGGPGRGYGPQARGDRPQFDRDMRRPEFDPMQRSPGFGFGRQGSYGPQGPGLHRGYGPQSGMGGPRFGPDRRGPGGTAYQFGRGGYGSQRGMRGPGYGPQGFGGRPQFDRGMRWPGGGGYRW